MPLKALTSMKTTLSLASILLIAFFLSACNANIIRTNSMDDLEDAKMVIDSFHRAVNQHNMSFTAFIHEKMYFEKQKSQMDSSIVSLYAGFGQFFSDSVVQYNTVTYSNNKENNNYTVNLCSCFATDTIYEQFYLLTEGDKLRIAGIEIKVP